MATVSDPKRSQPLADCPNLLFYLTSFICYMSYSYMHSFCIYVPWTYMKIIEMGLFTMDKAMRKHVNPSDFAVFSCFLRGAEPKAPHLLLRHGILRPPQPVCEGGRQSGHSVWRSMEAPWCWSHLPKLDDFLGKSIGFVWGKVRGSEKISILWASEKISNCDWPNKSK